MGVVIKVNFENVKPLSELCREEYKSIRTNVVLCGKKMKAIVVTSTLSGEGKTTVSFELSKSMAEAGKKCIYIDADLRKSTDHSRYLIDREVRGLTHYLSSMYEMDDVIYRSNFMNLSVIFAGPNAPNPVELLGNDRFKFLMEELKKRYDYIIVDTPPLGSVVDSAVIASTCDGAIMVIEAGNYQPRMVKAVKEQLEKAGCSVLGAVLNKAEVYDREYSKDYILKRYKNDKVLQ